MSSVPPVPSAPTGELIDEIKAVETLAIEELSAAGTVDRLQALDTELLGKRSSLNAFKKRLGALGADERREVGRALNASREAVEATLEGRRAALADRERAERIAAERLDLTEHPGTARRGHLHLVTQARDRLEDAFIGMGFTIAEGPEVETD
jgi:phenylalanyl-tRNA synthetase alpha chain